MTPPARRTAAYDSIIYAPGRRFRIASEGVSLTGLIPDQGGYRGWSQQLRPGDLLTCTGYGPGFGGDPGYGIEFTSAAAEAAGASHCEVRPAAGGAFDYRPAAGLLEPADAEQ